MLAAHVAGSGRQRAYVATTDQVWARHDLMPERLRAAILLGAFAGLRVAEACGLRVGETMLTGRDGGQLPPWALERAIRTARAKVAG